MAPNEAIFGLKISRLLSVCPHIKVEFVGVVSVGEPQSYFYVWSGLYNQLKHADP